ncbi:MAG: ABC transporter ATP-binding protein [Epulopiscium sp.]|nr:ABC transporter ATP-binding protein [Candidatus Epulonipiscium sp.]
MKPFEWIGKYIKPYRWRMFFALILVVIVSGLNMVKPYLSGKIVDDVIRDGQIHLLMNILYWLVGVTIVKSILDYAYKLMFESVSQNAIFEIRKELYTKLQKQDFTFFDTTRTGDIMARLTGDTDAIRHFIAGVILSIFSNSMLFIFALIMMFSINVPLTLIMLALTPIIGFFAYSLSQAGKPVFMKIREQFSKLNSVVQENISGNRVVKAFTKESYEIEKFTRENDGFRQASLEASRVWEKFVPILDSLAMMMSVVLILIGGTLVINKVISLGDLVMFNGYLWALNNPMRSVGWLINDVQRFLASAEKIISMLQREPRIKNKPDCIIGHQIQGDIEFKNVSFKYEREWVLRDIDFTVKAGQKVGIIGGTGAGKTSIMNLVARFYECTKGTILIDGIDIKDLEIRTLRDQIGMAMQDVFLFSDTIEGNIAYGSPDATMEEVLWAARTAGVQEFIDKFPEGYDTIVGERGVGLSGGQRQRIALARALLKQTPIILLDDTTSSVDMETEHRIHEALRSISQEQTTFIIAHRISSIKDADLILVLEHGEIIERGTHEELIRQKGEYYQTFLHQYGDIDSSGNQEVV